MPSFVQNRALRLAKFLISTIFYFLRLASRAVARLLGQRQPGSAVGIYYHQVFPEQRARFARQMDYLQRLTEPIRADRTEPLRAGVRYTMVTMDDGWSSFVENALPEMRARNIPVTIFVIAGRMGDSMGEAADHIVSETELRALAPDLASGLVTIGSHTSTHVSVTTLDPLRRLARTDRVTRPAGASPRPHSETLLFPVQHGKCGGRGVVPRRRLRASVWWEAGAGAPRSSRVPDW